jgi:anti-sigma-K factor RskA
MSMSHVTDSIPAYTLGALDEAESQEVCQHLEHCSACQAELNAYLLLVGQLATTVPQREPPVRLRAAILQKAVAQAAQAQSTRPGWKAWFSRVLSPAVGLAGLAVILVLVGLNLALWQQLQHPPAAPVPTPAAAAFRLVKMAPPQAGDASGLLIISQDGEYGTLVVDGLKILDATQQYQLWLIKDGKRTNGGVFSVEDSGYGMLEVVSPLPLADYQSFGITIEPFGGSPGPTGPKVLGGNL